MFLQRERERENNMECLGVTKQEGTTAGFEQQTQLYIQTNNKCVCVYMYIYVCVYIYIYIYTYVYIYIYIHTCVFVYIYIYICKHM